MGLTLSSHRPDQSATAHPDPEAWLTHEDGNSAWAVVKMPDTRERTRRRGWPRSVNRNLLVLGIGALLFVTVVYAAGQSESVRGTLGGWTPAPGDTDGVLVTYQDPDNDGDYERATVSDIDISGRHTTAVRIVDVEPFERVLARGQRTTSGTTSVITFSNVLLASEIEDADLVRVTIQQSHERDDDDDDDGDDGDDDDDDDDDDGDS